MLTLPQKYYVGTFLHKYRETAGAFVKYFKVLYVWHNYDQTSSGQCKYNKLINIAMTVSSKSNQRDIRG